MSRSAIEWCTHVWNPVTGCDRVSPGCANCYALTYAGRLKAMGQPKYQRDGGRASGPGFGLTLHEAALEEPERWRKPRRVFVNSMSDLFHDEVPIAFIEAVFGRMAGAPAHEFLVLTKRAERMAEVLNRESFAANALRASGKVGLPWPSPNVWLGVSIENRAFVHRAQLLRETPAAVRFVSAEPLLGPLVQPQSAATASRAGARRPVAGVELDLRGIDWLIAGGESGQHLAQAPHRFLVDTAGQPRADRADWLRDLRDACDSHGVAFFFKQWGGRTPKAAGRLLDARDWSEFPELEAVAA